MRDIFSDLYNKVLSFFVSQNVHDEKKSVAKSRLRTVLMQDRVGFSERAMQMLKEELVSTISKYMEIDEERFDLEINALDDATTLNLAIPVLRAKTDDEIDEAVKEQAIKTQAKAQEIVEELEELIRKEPQYSQAFRTAKFCRMIQKNPIHLMTMSRMSMTKLRMMIMTGMKSLLKNTSKSGTTRMFSPQQNIKKLKLRKIKINTYISALF